MADYESPTVCILKQNPEPQKIVALSRHCLEPGTLAAIIWRQCRLLALTKGINGKNNFDMKTLLLSLCYVAVLFIMVSLTDYALYWLLNNVVFNVINWYNHISIFWEVVIFVMGASIFFSMLGLIVNGLQVINGMVFYWFPSNWFTLVISLLVFISNSSYNIKILWDSIQSFNFLTTLEFIVLCLLIISINYIFVNRHKLKDRVEYSV